MSQTRSSTAGAVMLTETEQELPAASVPPVKEMLVAPAVAVNVPPQESVASGGVATIKPVPLPLPVGKVSVKEMPVSAEQTLALFGLLMVKVSVTVPPVATLSALNILMMVGG